MLPPPRSGKHATAFLLLASHLLLGAVGTSAVTPAGAEAPGYDRHENALELIGVRRTEERWADPAFLALTVNTTLLKRSGDWVEVSWSGSYTPSHWDYVALVVPADADVRSTAPAKYKNCRDAVPAASGSAQPTLRFRALNMRQPFRFVLFRDGLSYPVAVAKSEAVGFMNYNEPTQGHIALTATPGEMKAQWVTRDAVEAAAVRWGRSHDNLRHAAPAAAHTYTKDDLCGEPATSVGWVDPGVMHSATMTGLMPDTQYFYQYGDEDLGLSRVLSFVTPPVAGPHATVALLHVADMGQAEVDGSNELSMMGPSLNTTARLARELMRGDYRLVIHNGDISYARGYATQWDVFYDQIQPLATRVPWMTSVGNHERDQPFSGDRFDMVFDSGGECGVPYELRTGMPHPGRGQQWYSFDYGPIHFLQMSTEQPFAPGSSQYEFIVADLERVDRSVTPWLIVGGHRPFYVSTTYAGTKDSDATVAAELREALEELLVRHRVDMVWAGHHHSYQRSCKLRRSQCVEDAADGGYAAPVYVVAGHAGAALCNFPPTAEPYWEVLRAEFGYMRVTASGSSLSVEVVRSSDGSLMDAFHLTKPQAAHAGVVMPGIADIQWQ